MRERGLVMLDRTPLLPNTLRNTQQGEEKECMDTISYHFNGDIYSIIRFRSVFLKRFWLQYPLFQIVESKYPL